MQLPILYNKFIGMINAIDDSTNPIISSFFKSVYINPCAINIIGNIKYIPINIFLSFLNNITDKSIIKLGNNIEIVFS